MRILIKDIIKKILTPKFGKLDYNVVGTNHFPHGYGGNYGYVVTYNFKKPPPAHIRNEIITETETILKMMGLVRVIGIDARTYINVYGVEE
jgi:hypothetical protein